MSNDEVKPAPDAQAGDALGVFGKYLTLWVALCMVAGSALGVLLPDVATALAEAEVAKISIPIGVLIWIMVYPMMVAVDFGAVADLRREPRGLLVTTLVNWAVQPFLMFGLAMLFFRVAFASVMPEDLQKEYVAGSVILGGSPCTAMVFVWSQLANGDALYTLVQVAVNDLILLVLYVPTVALLIGATGVGLPFGTVGLSVACFIVLPLVAGVLTRRSLLLRSDGPEALQRFERLTKPATVVALLATLVLIFMFQGQRMVDRPGHVALIAIPLSLQNYIAFALAYLACWALRVRHSVAAPAAFIASSNFFELGVAVAISTYGPESGATLANVVGVLVEVPVMLSLVWIAMRSKDWYNRRALSGSDGVADKADASLGKDALSGEGATVEMSSPTLAAV